MPIFKKILIASILITASLVSTQSVFAPLENIAKGDEGIFSVDID